MNEQEIRQTILNMLEPVERTETRIGTASAIGLVVGIGFVILTYILGLSSSFYYGIYFAFAILGAVVFFYSERQKERAFKSYCTAFPPNSAERDVADRILSSLDEPKLAANAFRKRLKVESTQEGASEGRKQQAIAEHKPLGNHNANRWATILENTMNPNIIIAIGGVAGYVIACIFFGRQLPLLSIPAILGIFLGAAASVGVMYIAASPDRKRRKQNQSRQPDEATLRKNKSNIIANLQSQDADIRAEAITNLAILKDLDSVALLIPRLRDEDRMVRLRATEALAWITGQDFGEDEGKWNEWFARNKPVQQESPSNEK